MENKQICPLCEDIYSKKESTVFTQGKYNKKIKLLECKNCNLVFLNNYKKNRDKIYNKEYLIWKKSKEEEAILKESKFNSFEYQLKPLLSFKKRGGKLLDIGTGRGYLLDVAEMMGFNVYGVELSPYHAKQVNQRFPNKIFVGSFINAKYPPNFFDIVTAIDVLEHLNNPNRFFKKISKILKPGGLLLITTPNTDSITRKIFLNRWFQYKDEHVLYYNKESIKHIFKKYNFKIKKYQTNLKILSLTYYYHYFKKNNTLIISGILKSIFPLFPKFFKNLMFKNPLTGEIYVIAQKDG